MSFLRRRGGAGGTRTLRIGRVVGSALRTWFGRFLAIHLVAVACFLPVVAAAEGNRRRTESWMIGMSGAWTSAWYLAPPRTPSRWLNERGRQCLVGYAAQFAVTVLVIRLAYGSLGPPARGTILGAARLIPFAVGSLAVFVILDSAVVGSRGPVAFVPILAMSCLEAMLGATLVLAMPAVADGHGLLAALRRSWELGRGSRLRIAVLLALPIAFKWAPALLLDIEPRFPAYAVFLLLVGTFEACLLAVMYRQLCAMREGPRPEELSSIFS